jgi:type IV secretory pathway VirB2 component (pilin)
VFVIEKYSPVKITELPIGSYFFDSFSGTFVNSTNESIIFTPTGNGVEYVNFSQSSVGLYQNGSSMIRYLIDIVLAVGTFMIVLIGLVVGIDFMAGNEKEKAWDRLIAWLIAAFLFYGAMAGGPLIWGWLHLP